MPVTVRNAAAYLTAAFSACADQPWLLDAVKWCASGETVSAIADCVGCTRDELTYLLKRRNVQPSLVRQAAAQVRFIQRMQQGSVGEPVQATMDIL